MEVGRDYWAFYKNLVKFNFKIDVKNVLVIVAINIKDPLTHIHSEHTVELIKTAKELFNNLYSKILQTNTFSMPEEVRNNYKGQQSELK